MIQLPWIHKPPYGVKLNRQHPLAQGLVGCWLMNEGGGSNIFDLARYNHGVIDDVISWNSQGVLSPDLTDTKINLGPVGNLDQYTIIAKVVIHDETKDQTLCCLGNYDPAWAVNGLQQLYLYDGGEKTASSGTIDQDTEHTIAFARKGTGTDETEYFIDGKSAGTTTHADTISSTLNLTLCTDRAAGSDYALDATLFYFYIYNRALSASEMLSLYDNSYQIFEPLFIPSAVISTGSTLLPNSMNVYLRQMGS